MSFEITFDKELDCLVVAMTGRAGREDIMAARDQVIGHPDFRKDMNKIIDFTEGEMELETEDVKLISSHYADQAEQLGKHKVAYVAPSDLSFGRARQFDIIYGSNPGFEVRTFRSFNEAADWIRP